MCASFELYLALKALKAKLCVWYGIYDGVRSATRLTISRYIIESFDTKRSMGKWGIKWYNGADNLVGEFCIKVIRRKYEIMKFKKKIY